MLLEAARESGKKAKAPEGNKRHARAYRIGLSLVLGISTGVINNPRSS